MREMVGARALMSRVLGLGVIMLLCGTILSTSAFAAGDASTGECPNEESPGFRAYLSDCRGYELVSPSFEDGLEVGNFEVAEDGGGCWWHHWACSRDRKATRKRMVASMSSCERLGDGPCQAISPPASLFPAQTLLAASVDLTKTLWVARGPSESVSAETFYVREADGTIVKLGPVLPPAAMVGPPAGEDESFPYSSANLTKYLGASADLSHVLFGMRNVAATGLGWPGDTTLGAHSLYAYSPGDTRPELVGVSDGGR